MLRIACPHVRNRLKSEKICFNCFDNDRRNNAKTTEANSDPVAPIYDDKPEETKQKALEVDSKVPRLDNAAFTHCCVKLGNIVDVQNVVVPFVLKTKTSNLYITLTFTCLNLTLCCYLRYWAVKYILVDRSVEKYDERVVRLSLLERD